MCPQRLVCWGQMGPGCLHISAPLGKVHVSGLASEMPRTSFVATPSPDVSLQASVDSHVQVTIGAPLRWCCLPLR